LFTFVATKNIYSSFSTVLLITTSARIDTHRRWIWPLDTAKQGHWDRGIKVQFHGVNIGQTTAGKVSKQMDGCRCSPSKSSNKYKYKCRKERV